MKWLIGIVTALTVIAAPGCATPDAAQARGAQFVFAETGKTSGLSGETSTNIVKQAFAKPVAVTLMAKQAVRAAKLLKNKETVLKIVKRTEKYANKTWYVFAGATPRGWDCSGLVRWTYLNAGIELRHSASAQMNSGKKVKTPKVGDLVAFSYGGRYASHIGIYVGNGNFIHSPRPGVRTTIENVNRFAHNIGARVVYTRILEN